MPPLAPDLIHVRFFAVLREQAGTSTIELSTAAATPAELYAELQTSHRLTFRAELLKVAVNERYVPMDSPLHAGDQVVFIPPVAGG
ncbi:MAG TPA: molybdopterin converting factor subunit 1 [Lacunisphaera sp.]|jgi:molybdopterin synthase sulfur carrier subunit